MDLFGRGAFKTVFVAGGSSGINLGIAERQRRGHQPQ